MKGIKGMDKKFIMTMDPGVALQLSSMGFKKAGQNGKQWFFVNNESLVNDNKKQFAKLKYTTTNKITFAVNSPADAIYATQYVKD